MKIWDEVEKAYAERKVVIGRVIERIKGGLAVDIGVRAFLPGSQIDVRPVRNLDALRGQELRMRVIKVNKKRGNIVLSRKALLEEENAEKKKHTLETLAEGKVLKGVVKNITDYGAFIDLGGIDGLLHITDMSWGRVGHPSELFKVNDEIDVIVLKYDPATERVSLGHKQLITDPWANVLERYPVGARAGGKVVSLTDYGAFVELEAGVEGLIHVSERSWSKRAEHPARILNVADTVEGKVVRMTNFGAFVELDEGIRGLIHVSEFDDSHHAGKEGKIELTVGETYPMKIIKLAPAERKIGLSIRALKSDEFRADWEAYQESAGDGTATLGEHFRNR